jgi:alpha-beta hydrolase superfamily lysophospholipase
MNARDYVTLTDTHFPGFETLPDSPVAGLVIVHGIAEHSGRYRHVAEALASRNIACFVYDQQGHGLFPGSRTDIADFRHFARDLETVGESIQRRHPTLPLFVWGHSMGSVVVTLAAADGLNWARGAITTGEALDALPKLSSWSGRAARIGAALLPKARISLKIDGTLLTHVEAAQREHMSDPLVPRSASLRLLYGFAAACAFCDASISQIRKPWLAIHGEADTVCPVSGSRRLIERLASSDKQLVLYEGLRHEVHNEDGAAQTVLFDLMSAWIQRRAGR